MYLPLFFFILAPALTVHARGGSAGLDAITFHKVVPKFKTALVKFDPINTNFFDKENLFREIVREFGETEDFLFAEVELEEKDDLHQRYSMTYKDYPVLKLFKGSLDDPVNFNGEWTRENILQWVKANSNVRFSLPSCLSSFDELAESFMASEPAERAKLLEKAKAEGAKLEGKAKSSADVYLKIMKLTLDRGNGFVASEEARVKNLLEGKISQAKKDELRARLNIILSFKVKKEEEKVAETKAPQTKAPPEKEPEAKEPEAKPATQSKATQTDEQKPSKPQSKKTKSEL